MARRDDRIAEEIAFHIEQQTAKHIAAGMSPEDALRAARLKFGGVDAGARGDARRAARRLAARPRPRSADRLPLAGPRAVVLADGDPHDRPRHRRRRGDVHASSTACCCGPCRTRRPTASCSCSRSATQGRRGANVSEPNFVDWQAQTRGFAAMAETAAFPQTVLGAGEPQSVPVAMVSHGLLRRHGHAAGARPRVPRRRAAARGRARGAGRRPLLGALEGRSPLSGESIVIGGVAHAVVGVMPPGFDYPREAVIWTPREQGDASPSRTAHNFRVVARVRPGSTSRRPPPS